MQYHKGDKVKLVRVEKDEDIFVPKHDERKSFIGQVGTVKGYMPITSNVTRKSTYMYETHFSTGYWNYFFAKELERA